MTPSTRRFRAVAVAEAVSYLVLLAASVAKHVFGVPGAVAVVGPVHGVIFLAYLWLALVVREEQGWSRVTTLSVVVAAVVPLGGLYVERRVVPDAPPASHRDPVEPSPAG